MFVLNFVAKMNLPNLGVGSKYVTEKSQNNGGTSKRIAVLLYNEQRLEEFTTQQTEDKDALDFLNQYGENLKSQETEKLQKEDTSNETIIEIQPDIAKRETDEKIPISEETNNIKAIKEATNAKTKKAKSSVVDKPRQACPTCGKMFVRIASHKCKSKVF